MESAAQGLYTSLLYLIRTEQRAKNILIAEGSIVAGKKLSGAQRRKRRKLTLELEAEDKKKKDKNIQICPE